MIDEGGRRGGRGGRVRQQSGLGRALLPSVRRGGATGQRRLGRVVSPRAPGRHARRRRAHAGRQREGGVGLCRRSRCRRALQGPAGPGAGRGRERAGGRRWQPRGAAALVYPKSVTGRLLCDRYAERDCDRYAERERERRGLYSTRKERARGRCMPEHPISQSICARRNTQSANQPCCHWGRRKESNPRRSVRGATNLGHRHGTLAWYSAYPWTERARIRHGQYSEPLNKPVLPAYRPSVTC